MENVLKINAGIACLDRANEVEPRPNEEKSRRDDMSVENSTFSIQKSRRDDMSVENYIAENAKQLDNIIDKLIMPQREAESNVADYELKYKIS
ncbi:MAG: hypothetical protein LBG80_04900 [Bacteroidales bacterium]|nr:hypothetical protein [Bacteroidales bacterium]